jgi:hypothetical protein
MSSESKPRFRLYPTGGSPIVGGKWGKQEILFLEQISTFNLEGSGGMLVSSFSLQFKNKSESGKAGRLVK